MDRTLNNEISNEKRTNDEIKNFMKGVQNSLDKTIHNTVNEIVLNEVCNEIELASKYKAELNTIIDEAFDIESYENEFLCLNYDDKTKSYYLDHYYDGNRDKIEMTNEEINELKNTGGKVGQFYKFYNDEHLVEAEYIKDSIKINVDTLLNKLELKK